MISLKNFERRREKKIAFLKENIMRRCTKKKSSNCMLSDKNDSVLYQSLKITIFTLFVCPPISHTHLSLYAGNKIFLFVSSIQHNLVRSPCSRLFIYLFFHSNNVYTVYTCLVHVRFNLKHCSNTTAAGREMLK